MVIREPLIDGFNLPQFQTPFLLGEQWLECFSLYLSPELLDNLRW